MNNISELDNKKCTGCMACKNICPKYCIDSITDELGFQYPKIDEAKCIKCGICSKVCPALNKNINKNDYEMVFAAINKDYKSWENSSSGGAFKALCDTYCSIYPITTIYGASYDAKLISVKHIGIELNNISLIQKSKYVQSSMENIYNEIAVKLKNNENVVFSGTPCQNLALRNFLELKNISISNILFIDFICHGVGSPETFKESLKNIFREKQIDTAEVLNVSHRGKKVKYFHTQSYNTQIVTKFKKRMIKSYKDLHVNLFFQKLNCRDSCEECAFANQERYSDITIADFKKFYQEFPTVKNKKNASTIIVHTQNGKQIFDKTREKFDIYDSTMNVIKKNNPIYFHSIKCGHPEKRNEFRQEFKNIKNSDRIICMSQYASKISLKSMIKLSIPEQFKERIRLVYDKWRKK